MFGNDIKINIYQNELKRLKLLSAGRNLSAGKKHVCLRFDKMLRNCETPSELSQKRKISVANVY